MRRKLTETLVANKGTVVAEVVVVVLALVASSLVGLDPPFVIALLVPFGVAIWGVYRWRSRSPGSRPARAPAGKLAWSGLAALIAVFLLAQAVPYGRDHSNPQITGEPDWNTPLTRELVVRACFDRHSNEVDWPWYSNIAPISWATWKHVEDGRDAVNYQEWDRPQDEAEESLDEVKKGSMPPGYYTFGGLHSRADLTSAELAALLDGLAKTPGLSE